MNKFFLSLLTLSLIGCAHTKEETNHQEEEPVMKYECYDQVPTNTPVESTIKENKVIVNPGEPNHNFPKRLYIDKN